MFATTTDDREAAGVAPAAGVARTDVDRELEAAIEPWLEHMRWRADFRSWREGRLWQEKRQKGTLNNLRAFLRVGARASNGGAKSEDSLAGRLILDLGCGM